MHSISNLHPLLALMMLPSWVMRCLQEDNRDQRAQKTPTKRYSTIRPSVHAKVNFNVSRSKCVNGSPVTPNLLWDIQSKKGEFQLDDAHLSLTIPKDGRYFVYSQVTFSCVGCNCKEDSCCGEKTKGPTTVWQEVIHKMLGYEKPNSLFISVGSINETKSHKSLYLAAVMLFKKGDKMMVGVSNPSLVVTDYHYTFFGAYFIS